MQVPNDVLNAITAHSLAAQFACDLADILYEMGYTTTATKLYSVARQEEQCAEGYIFMAHCYKDEK